jgi:hypothetical protein
MSPHPQQPGYQASQPQRKDAPQLPAPKP